MNWLCLLLFSAVVSATTFQPQSMEQQLKEADGILVGNFLKQKTIELEDGKLATQMIFKMNKELGFQSDLFGMDEVIVHYPGGHLGDRHVRVEGTPDFIPGENVVLFIKNVHNRYWGLNLGFGSFKVVNYGPDKLLMNSLFPEDSRVSQIRYEDFEKKVRSVKGSSLRVVLQQHYPTKEVKGHPQPTLHEGGGKKRSIASEAQQVENEDDRPNQTIPWLIAVLAILGGFFRFMRQKA
jgi:hypothetical protein